MEKLQLDSIHRFVKVILIGASKYNNEVCNIIASVNIIMKHVIDNNALLCDICNNVFPLIKRERKTVEIAWYSSKVSNSFNNNNNIYIIICIIV